MLDFMEKEITSLRDDVMKLLKLNADIIKRLESVDFINVEMEKRKS